MKKFPSNYQRLNDLKGGMQLIIAVRKNQELETCLSILVSTNYVCITPADFEVYRSFVCLGASGLVRHLY